mgnify:FL=1
MSRGDISETGVLVFRIDFRCETGRDGMLYVRGRYRDSVAQCIEAQILRCQDDRARDQEFVVTEWFRPWELQDQPGCEPPGG